MPRSTRLTSCRTSASWSHSSVILPGSGGFIIWMQENWLVPAVLSLYPFLRRTTFASTPSTPRSWEPFISPLCCPRSNATGMCTCPFTMSTTHYSGRTGSSATFNTTRGGCQTWRERWCWTGWRSERMRAASSPRHRPSWAINKTLLPSWRCEKRSANSGRSTSSTGGKVHARIRPCTLSSIAPINGPHLQQQLQHPALVELSRGRGLRGSLEGPQGRR